MNKLELEKTVQKLQKQIEDLKKDNEYLLKEQKKYIKLAEKQGTELAPYKAMVVRLQEEMGKLEATLKILGDKQ